MSQDTEDTRLPRLWRAEIEDAIRSVYQKTKEPSLTELRAALTKHFDAEIKKIGRVLGQWTGDSPYGQFLDRPTSIKFDKDIVCFDLKGLEAYPDLQAVCLYVITDFVWRAIQADRSSKKFLIFDECWKLLENKSGCAFIGDVFRTFRKYYASAIAISQTMDDFAKSAVADAILPNAATKWVLPQKGANEARLKEILRLNDAEALIVNSLRQERGLYSEAYLIAGEQRTKVSIETTPLEYWIATTDPRETDLLQRYQQQYQDLSQREVIAKLAMQYPHGLQGRVIHEVS